MLAVILGTALAFVTIYYLCNILNAPQIISYLSAFFGLFIGIITVNIFITLINNDNFSQEELNKMSGNPIESLDMIFKVLKERIAGSEKENR